MLLKVRYPSTVLAVFALFTGVWFVLAGNLTTWSDEITQIATAKGILQTGNPFTGKPFIVFFDHCAQLLSSQYHRAVEVSRLTALSYEIFGDSITAARLVPFAFTIATWLLFIGYTRWRGYSSGPQILVVTILFFGQSMILEKSLFVRMYAPMLFFLVLSLIAVWEAVIYWRARKLPLAIAALGLAVVSMGITAGWHLLQFAIFALAVAFLGMMIRRIPPKYLLQRGWNQLASLPGTWRYLGIAFLVLAAAGTMTVAPQVINVLGAELVGLPKVFSTPWDNLFGLLRFLLVTNVLLVLWWRRSQSPDSDRDFNSWILDVGVISGLLVALLMNHSLVFYTRFFYLSAALVTLGVSGMIVGLPSKQHVAAALGIYVVVNAFLSVITFQFDRDNSKSAINWLESNSSEQDIVLTFGGGLELNSGSPVCGRTESIYNFQREDGSSDSSLGVGGIITHARRAAESSYPFITGDQLIGMLDSNPDADVYFMYTDGDHFRDTLFSWTTGRSRTQRNDLYGIVMGRPSSVAGPDLFKLLKDGDVGQDVMSGLRGGAGLKRIDRGRLLAALEDRTFP